jgi:hypothetical protein
MEYITVGMKKYYLFSFTGVVKELGKEQVIYTFGQHTTQIHSGNSRQIPPVRIETSVKAFNHILLCDRKGKEHYIRLADFDIACREGHELSVVWAVKGQEMNGPPVVVINNSTAQCFFCVATITKMFRPSALFYITVALSFYLAATSMPVNITAVMLILVLGSIAVVIAGNWFSWHSAQKFMRRFHSPVEK